MKYIPENKSRSSQKVVSLSPSAPASMSRITNFSITTDSVVATLQMTTDENSSLINIYWGDESDDNGPQSIDMRKERLAAADNLSPNQLKVQHVYSTDTFRRYVLVECLDKAGNTTWESAVLDLNPRYKFIIYPMHLAIYSHLDTDFESNSEFDVLINLRNRGEIIYSKLWQPDIHTFRNISDQYPIMYKLEGSEASFEMNYTDPGVKIDGLIREKDNPIKNFLKWLRDVFTHEFDGSVTLDGIDEDFPFHPKFYEGYKQFDRTSGIEDGKVDLVIRTELNLIVPLDIPSHQVLAPA